MTYGTQLYTGVDSAWGGSSPGGVCTLHGGDGPHVTLRQPPVRQRWDALVEQARHWDAASHVVAVDQPIVVRNIDSMRPVELLISRHFMKPFRCGAYPANLSNVGCFGSGAGIWRLVAALEGQGFEYDPAGAVAGGSGRLYFECYPHLSLLGMFDEPRVLRYKVHKKEPDEWRRLLRHLIDLREFDYLPLRDACGFLSMNLEHTKANEDLLDALVCSYTAAWAHRRGMAHTLVLGDATTGAIVAPASQAMRDALPPDASVDAVEAGSIPVPIPTRDPAVEEARTSAARSGGHSAQEDPAGDATPSPLGQWRTATLWATDTGCVWRNQKRRPRNAWLDRFTAVRLRVAFVELDGEPEVEFVPFENDGEQQQGLRPSLTCEQRALWAFISDGCSKRTPRRYEVRYRFDPDH